MRLASLLLAPALALSAQQGHALKLGDAMPAFALPGVDGRTLASRDLKGPVLVAWLSTECPVARATEDRINALAKAYQGRITVVGINSNAGEPPYDENLPAMKARAGAKGYAFPYLRDEDQQVVKAFGALCTPDFFLFDAKGRLVYRGRLDDNAMQPSRVTRQDLKAAVDALLSGQPISPDQPPARGCSIKYRKP